MSWRDLLVIVEKQPRDDSALVREREGNESHQWNLTTYLLAGIFDQLAGANWQRGGGRGPKPKPIPRPGATEVETKKRGKQAVSIAELDKFLRSTQVEVPKPAPAKPPRKRDARGRFAKS